MSQISYYYHGSPIELDILKPMGNKTSVIDNENAVFATNTKWLAIFFIANDASDSDIECGFINNIPYLIEQYPGAYNKFLKGKSGYLHYVDYEYFNKDDRLGMPNHEFISKTEVPILKVNKIDDIYVELQKEPVIMLSWDDKENMIANELEKRNKIHSGGYHEKYIKWKRKYLDLKSELNRR
jgi:hypothetical protein